MPDSTPNRFRTRAFRLRGRSLREHAARGTLVNGAFTVGASLLGLIKGFILAGLLAAEDYGVWGILVVSLGTLLWLKQVGIGDKFIQQDEDDQELAFQKAFTLEAMVTAVFMVVLAAALPLIAIVYGQPEVVGPGLVLLAVLPAGVLQAPLWVHYRNMEFVRQRTLQAVDPIVGFVVSIALAVAGTGYWALAGGILAGAWAAAFAALWRAPFRPRFRYDRGTLRAYAGFSWPLFFAGAGGMVIAQSSVLVTEAQLGLAATGALTLAATISQFTDRVDGVITGTLYPAICAVRDRLDLLLESFVKSNRIALMWAVPFGFGLSLFAADLVDFGLGEQWQPAVVLLQMYGVIAALGHIGFNWDAYMRARGTTRPMAIAATAAAIAFLASLFPLVAAYGLTGLAIATGIQGAVHVTCRAIFLAQLFDGFGFVRHALRAILPTLPAVGAVLLLRAVESGDRTLGVALGELGLYGALIAVATLAFEGALVREAVGYLRTRPSSAPSVAPTAAGSSVT